MDNKLWDIWLCQYPRPQMVHVDNGNEFKAEFMQLCRNYGLKGKPMSEYIYNPQANDIIERLYSVMVDMLWTLKDEERSCHQQCLFSHSSVQLHVQYGVCTMQHYRQYQDN
jgi:3-phenylpropionate/cinnamic acid dioxygenase small subunit